MTFLSIAEFNDLRTSLAKRICNPAHGILEVKSAGDKIQLSSGYRSSLYFNFGGGLVWPEFRHDLGKALAYLLSLNMPPQHDALMGVPEGATSLAQAVSDVLWRETCRQIPAVPMRAQEKSAGSENDKGFFPEKLLPPGSRVIGVEDVITTGGSTHRKLLQPLRARGVDVPLVMVALDRSFGRAAESLAHHGVRLLTLLTLEDMAPQMAERVPADLVAAEKEAIG